MKKPRPGQWEKHPLLPDYAYAHHPVTGDVVLLENGSPSYVDVKAVDMMLGRRGGTAEELNATRFDPPVTPAQAAAMLAGSMFGFDTPAAMPASYDERGNPIRKP